MSLEEQIANDLKDALKAKDSLKLSTLRLLLGALKNEEIKVRGEKGAEAIDKTQTLCGDLKGQEGGGLEDTKVVEVVSRELKKRKEAIELYNKGGRSDLAKKEEEEMEILKKYLPEQLSSDKIKEAIEEVIKETAAGGPSDFGRVMGAVMAKVKGRADGAVVQELVKEALG